MKRLTQNEVLERFKKIHGDKYDYSKVNYISNHTKINITCPIHGSWTQTPSDHLHGHGCMGCRNNKLSELKYDLKQIKDRCVNTYGEKYNYDNIIEYKGITESIIIECEKHKYKFKTTFFKHLQSKDGGCRKCHYETNRIKLSSNTPDFIEKSKKIHGGKYDYSKVKYVNNYSKVIIECDIHGSFEQTPLGHIINKQGCPGCKESKGEKLIRVYLENNNIKFIPQYSYNDCKYIRKLFFDFYLPDFNILIEFDGKQHFEPIEWLHEQAETTFHLQVKKDQIKNKYCLDNNIKLIRISYKDIRKINKILKEGLVF
jgi:very-short-patch-repair endonuclease